MADDKRRRRPGDAAEETADRPRQGAPETQEAPDETAPRQRPAELRQGPRREQTSDLPTGPMTAPGAKPPPGVDPTVWADAQRYGRDMGRAEEQAANRPPTMAAQTATGGTGAPILGQPIGREQVLRAGEILLRYKTGKAHLEARVVEDEQWYKLRHWDQMRDKKREVQPVSAWLFNAIASKHADALDAIPAPTILAREQEDREEAHRLSSIVPVIMEQCDFEQVYSDVTQYKLKTGTGVYGVFWDPDKYGGLGDVSIKKVDLLNLFWEPGVTDIQDSPNLFCVTLTDNDQLLQQYPQLQDKLGGDTATVTKYVHDESISTSDKSDVVEWYYKRLGPDGRETLHYVKYVNDVVLFASENDRRYAGPGFYNHASYPYVFDVLFPVEGMPTGFGYIDIGKDVQAYIDRANQAILENMLANARPRHFINASGSVNEAEFADVTQDFVHVDGQLGQDSIRPIEATPLTSLYFEVLQGKIDELKETTGNRDVSNGGTQSGATAASAIAAMQEAGGKLSRDHSKSAYRAYRKVVLLVIELIRQFYDLPRQFRITGAQGVEEYITYVNTALQPQEQNAYDIAFGRRLPLMDVKVDAQKQSPYSRLAQNELALQLYTAGLFNPQMGDQASLALELMDFEGIDAIRQKVAQNSQLFQMMMAMQAQIDALNGVQPGADGGGPAAGGAPREAGGKADEPPDTDELGGLKRRESPVTKKARQAAAERTTP